MTNVVMEMPTKKGNVENVANEVANELSEMTRKEKRAAAKKAKKAAKVNILAEGVTGKQLMKLKCDANAAHKKDMGSLSRCMKRAFAFGAVEGYYSAMRPFAGLNEHEIVAKLEKECKPATISKHRTNHEAGFKNWSVWVVMNCVKRIYEDKATK